MTVLINKLIIIANKVRNGKYRNNEHLYEELNNLINELKQQV